MAIQGDQTAVRTCAKKTCVTLQGVARNGRGWWWLKQPSLLASG